MRYKKKLYTSIWISSDRKEKLETCAALLGIDEIVLFSVLCYKGGRHICTKSDHFKNIKYQQKQHNYTKKNIYLYAGDHEYMSAHRHMAKLSVSLIFRLAIDRFLDEIMENGINDIELLLHLRMVKNSYSEKKYIIRNFETSVKTSSSFDEYIMKMRMEKT